MTTLRDLVHEVRRELAGPNTEKYATFKGWVLDGSDKVGITLEDVETRTTKVLVELDTELVYVSSIDATTGQATCPPWFRQQQGTPANESFAVDSRVTVNPQWPSYELAKKVCQGIAALYPHLFGVQETELVSSAINGNYLVPSDVDGVLHLTEQMFGPGEVQLPVSRYSLDIKNTDGLRYLRAAPSVPNQTLRLTYLSKPVVPDPSDLDATWASTGLPDSAADLPVKYAVMCLLPSADASKTQTNSVEQSDRNKFVQGGSANATSRRLQEIYQARLSDERRKLVERYPVRPHKEMS